VSLVDLLEPHLRRAPRDNDCHGGRQTDLRAIQF
jgi:hypothetical protein